MACEGCPFDGRHSPHFGERAGMSIDDAERWRSENGGPDDAATAVHEKVQVQRRDTRCSLGAPEVGHSYKRAREVLGNGADVDGRDMSALERGNHPPSLIPSRSVVEVPTRSFRHKRPACKEEFVDDAGWGDADLDYGDGRNSPFGEPLADQREERVRPACCSEAYTKGHKSSHLFIKLLRAMKRSQLNFAAQFGYRMGMYRPNSGRDPGIPPRTTGSAP